MIETFGIPLREIDEKFTRSELVLTAWRSREQAYNMRKKFKEQQSEVGVSHKYSKSGKKRKNYDGIGPDRMPDKFFDEHGDFNLSKVTAEEASSYFQNVLGLPLPPIGEIGASRNKLGVK